MHDVGKQQIRWPVIWGVEAEWQGIVTFDSDFHLAVRVQFHHTEEYASDVRYIKSNDPRIQHVIKRLGKIRPFDYRALSFGVGVLIKSIHDTARNIHGKGIEEDFVENPER